MLQTLRVVRGGAPPTTNASVGYYLYVPAMRLGDLAMPADGDAIAALGFPDVDREGTRITQIDASTLVMPTRWEELFIDWVSSELAAPVLWPQTVSRGDITDALETGGWATPSDMPEHVSVRRAATRRGEVKATVRDIRQTVASAEDCDKVLILLPRSSAMRALWIRELEDADLPVRAAHFESIDSHAISRWVLALSQLSRWDTHPVSRFHVRTILEGKYWRQESLGENVRRGVRNALAAIRREAFTLSQWRRHLVSHDVNRWDRGSAQTWTDRIWRGVKEGPKPFQRLLKLVLELGIRQAVQVRGDSRAPDVCEKVLATLEELAYVEERRGAHPLVKKLGATQVLATELGRTYLNHSRRSDHGVRITTYDQYDGSSADLLIAAGLGEGDFPRIPTMMDAHQASWARALGLMESDESPADLVMHEIKRQMSLFGVAADQAQRVVLSYANEGAGTEVRHPGPLLSLLVGSWTAEDWYSHPQIKSFEWSDEVPAAPTDAPDWRSARLFGWHEGFREWVSPHDTGDTVELLHNTLRTSREALAERSPSSDQSSTFGHYSGRLPAGVQEPDAYSASSLENYGQCGTKYFLRNVLTIRDNEDQPDQLDAREVGTLLHRAFSDAARKAIDIAEDELWSLCWRPGENPDDVVERITFSIALCLDAVVKEYLKQQVTLSDKVTDAIVERWRPAIKRWVVYHLRPWLPAMPGEEHYADDVRVQDAQKALDQAQRVLETVDALAAAIADGSVTTQDRAAKIGDTFRGVLSQADLKKAYKHREDSGVEDLRAEIEAKLQQATVAHQAALESVEERFENYINREVAHAEFSFGLDLERIQRDADPHSIPTPISIQVDGVELKVKGQVDRIDWDRERNRLAIRDFKTGKGKSRDSLEKRLLTGEHLQLPLYALAIEELARQGVLAHLDGSAEVAEISLEFPRDPKDERYAPEIALDAKAGAIVNGDSKTWRELSQTWLSSHLSNMREGNFLLLPNSCPIEGRGYCDYERACGYTVALGERCEDPRTLPEIEIDASVSSRQDKFYPEVMRPIADVQDLDRDTLREHHERATVASTDLETDVFISAGAGTGKTYNLVLRYLAALADGCEPSEILCITFTRRAASEMKRRVREALLRTPEGPQRPYVEAIRADEERFRRILIQLSTAPITTIDSLAGEIFRECHGAQAAADGEPARTFEVCTDDDVAEELATYVSDQYLGDFEKEEPHLMALTKTLDPVRLRALLTETCGYDVPESIAQKDSLEDRAESIKETWLMAMQRAADAVCEVVKSWDVDELNAAYEEAQRRVDKPIADEAAKLCEAATFAVSSLQTTKKTHSESAWRNIAQIINLPTNKTRGGQNWLGDSKLRKVWKANQEELAELFAYDPDRDAAVQAFCSAFERIDFLAETAAHSTFVSQRWSKGFREYLQEHGKVRFSDIEALAYEMVRDRSLESVLKARFPLRHIFVDEAQDTSYRQLSLLDTLRERIQTASRPIHLFFVGDLKQSIYAFRGAEVDVFNRRISSAIAHADRTSEKFTINRRSTPNLLDAINRLFASVFPAEGEEGSLDPRSDVPFEGLVAPEGTSEKPAPIELIVARGRGLEDEEADDSEDDEELEDDDSTVLQRATIARLSELAQEYPPLADGPQIAVLVGSWARAEVMRDLLSAHGVSAAVQGGRGLLGTDEVESLVCWLESETHENLRTPFLATLRGPGISISDVGLYCLRRGHGVTLKDGGEVKSLKQAAFFAESFDADAAAREWLGDDHAELDAVRAQLELDAASLSRFQETRTQFKPRVGVDATSDVLSWLADELGLWTFWAGTENGRQRVANLRTFLDLVRDLEESTGNDPQTLVRRLAAMRNTSDPSAGGLTASNGAAVVITTYWQSKGLEWPVVVLPDLHATKIRGQKRGLSISRVFLPDVQERVVFSPEVRESHPEKPLWSDKSDVSKVLDQYRNPAARAELRRLLYVAMTRAKYKLLMSTRLSVPTRKNRTGHPEATTLSEAKDWSTTLRVTLGLTFDDDGPQVMSGSPWAPLVESGDVVLIDAHAADGPRQQPVGDTELELPDEALIATWKDHALPVRTYLKPSDHRVDEVPPHDPKLSTPLPMFRTNRVTRFNNDADAGTAFHALMEKTGFLWVADPWETAYEVIHDLRLDVPEGNVRARIDETLDLYEGALAAPVTRELRAAALAGRLFHEVPLSFPWAGESEDNWVNGVVDLMWYDRDGLLHLLDYKTGYKHPTEDQPITPELKKHYAQVWLYAQGLKTCGVELGSFGVWYVAGGAILRWT